jgi:uncharacterized protein (DUF4415 family)
MKKHSETDWARVDALSDKEIDTSDIPPVTAARFPRAALRLPRRRIDVRLHVDSDVMAWFKAQGEDYERRMNTALRIYAEAHESRT